MKMQKCAFIVWLFVMTVLYAAPAGALQAGEAAPDFTLKSIEGETVSLSDFKGRLVFLKLATTWCPTCKQLSGEIGKVVDLLNKNNVAFLEVFVQDTEETVKKYINQGDLPETFHALLDDGSAYEAYNVYLIPRLLVIDPDQKVVFDSAGRVVLASDLTAMVEGLTSGAESTN